MRKMNLKRLRILSKVTKVMNRMAKISTQAIDIEAHLFTSTPLCLPFDTTAGFGSAQSRHFSTRPSGFRFSGVWDSAEM